MSEVAVADLTVRYGTFEAVCGVSFELESGRSLAILGSSGSGKSSLLRAIAGLESVASGVIRIGGQEMAGVPTYRRGIGLMFQDHALFPHLSVGQNVAFGLRMERWSKEATRERVREMLDLVQLSERSEADVMDLSGGEQQRVALARTLAPRPKVVLLDEPLGSLDRVLREELLVTMQEAFAATGATVVFVTHDQSEAFAVGEQIALMSEGRFRQVGTAKQLWEAPIDRWTARFVGQRNIVPAVLLSASEGGMGTPRSSQRAGVSPAPMGDVLLRPDRLSLLPLSQGTPEPDSAAGSMTLVGRVRSVAFREGYSVVNVKLTEGGRVVEVWTFGEAPATGSDVLVEVPKDAVRGLE